MNAREKLAEAVNRADRLWGGDWLAAGSAYRQLRDAARELLDEMDIHFPPPAPVPALRKGDRVRWYRGEDSGTGTYWGVFDGLHQVTLAAIKGDEDEPRVRLVACAIVELLQEREP